MRFQSGKTYKRIECATILRSHQYTLRSALGVAGARSRLPARTVSVLLIETGQGLASMPSGMPSYYCAQRCALLVHTIAGARFTVRIEAAEDDIITRFLTLTEGCVRLSTIRIQWISKAFLT